jgi:hypothetical protein
VRSEKAAARRSRLPCKPTRQMYTNAQVTVSVSCYLQLRARLCSQGASAVSHAHSRRAQLPGYEQLSTTLAATIPRGRGADAQARGLYDDAQWKQHPRFIQYGQ